MWRPLPLRRITPETTELLFVGVVVLVLGSIGLQLFGWGDDYWSSVVVMAGIYSLLAMGLNVVVGQTGLLDLGYAGFWAVGAYMTAIITGRSPISPVAWGVWGALPFAILATVLSGLALGAACLRVRGDYLAIVTLGFGEIIRIIAGWWDPVTRGPRGLEGIPHPTAFGLHFGLDPRPYVVLVLVLVALMYVVLDNMWHSKTGRAWYATRTDEAAAEAVGVPTFRTKLLAFAMGASTAGFAGVIYSSYVSFVSPDNFVIWVAIMIMASIVLGGLGNSRGAILGAFAVVALPELFRSMEERRMLVFGAMLTLMMIIRPRGILPLRIRHFKIPPPKAWKIARRAPAEEPLSATMSARSDVAHTEEHTGSRNGDHETILECTAATRRFGALVAVKEVSFGVRKGAIFAIIGPNGAGKTTLFNLLTGALRPDGGDVSFEGRSVVGLQPHDTARLGMARTFQLIRLFGDVTVAENVLVGGDAHTHATILEAVLRSPRHRREEQEAYQEASDLLEFCGIRNLADEQAMNLSYGDQRRVEIARALATRPRILLLDEPAAGMNPSEKKKVMDLIRKIRDEGITVLLVEHDMSVVMGISDEVLVLDHGEIIARGRPDEVRRDKKVIEAYLGEDVYAAE